jgi:hypothetical protein
MKKITIKKRISNPKWWQWLSFWTLNQEYQIDIPEAWAEVKPVDLLPLFDASLMNLDPGARQFECVKAILPADIKDEAHLIHINSIFRIAQFMEFCEPRTTSANGEWIHDEEKMLNELPTYGIVLSDKNLLTEVLKSFHLPGKDLEFITCLQFKTALDGFKKIQGGNRAAGWEVVAALLTPAVSIDFLKETFKYPQAELILRYFMDSLEKIHYTVKQLSPTFLQVADNDVGGGGIDFGWEGVFLQVAKDGVFGDYQKVLKSPFHDVYMYCIMKHEEVLKIKKEIEANDNKI